MSDLDLIRPGDVVKVTQTLQYAWFDDDTEEHVLFDMVDEAIEMRHGANCDGTLKVEMVKKAVPPFNDGALLPGSFMGHQYTWPLGTVFGYEHEDEDEDETKSRFILNRNGKWYGAKSGIEYEAGVFRKYHMKLHHVPE